MLFLIRCTTDISHILALKLIIFQCWVYNLLPQTLVREVFIQHHLHVGRQHSHHNLSGVCICACSWVERLQGVHVWHCSCGLNAARAAENVKQVLHTLEKPFLKQPCEWVWITISWGERKWPIIWKSCRLDFWTEKRYGNHVSSWASGSDQTLF